MPSVYGWEINVTLVSQPTEKLSDKLCLPDK